MEQTLIKLKGKTILITGGTSGIGLGVVKHLAEENRVIVLSRKGTLPDDMYDGKSLVKLYHIEFRDRVASDSVMDAIARNFAPLDVLINQVHLFTLQVKVI